jgi:protein phosphatase methylesterase 1
MTSRLGGDGNLRDSLLKSRISKLPHLPAIAPSQWSSNTSEEQEEDGIGDLSMAPPLRSTSQRSAESRSLDLHYTPLSAHGCFQEALEVEVDYAEDRQGNPINVAETDGDRAASSTDTRGGSKAVFRVYYTPPKASSIERKRGTGSMATANDDGLPSLDSLKALEVDEIDESNERDSPKDPGTIFFFHHGAGYSALSYALVAKNITEETKGKAGVLAFDCRGHGGFSCV